MCGHIFCGIIYTRCVCSHCPATGGHSISGTGVTRLDNTRCTVTCDHSSRTQWARSPVKCGHIYSGTLASRLDGTHCPATCGHTHAYLTHYPVTCSHSQVVVSMHACHRGGV